MAGNDHGGLRGSQPTRAPQPGSWPKLSRDGRRGRHLVAGACSLGNNSREEDSGLWIPLALPGISNLVVGTLAHASPARSSSRGQGVSRGTGPFPASDRASASSAGWRCPPLHVSLLPKKGKPFGSTGHVRVEETRRDAVISWAPSPLAIPRNTSCQGTARYLKFCNSHGPFL